METSILYVNCVMTTSSPQSLEGGERGYRGEGLGKGERGTWYQQESCPIYSWGHGGVKFLYRGYGGIFKTRTDE